MWVVNHHLLYGGSQKTEQDEFQARQGGTDAGDSMTHRKLVLTRPQGSSAHLLSFFPFTLSPGGGTQALLVEPHPQTFILTQGLAKLPRLDLNFHLPA